MKENRKIAQSIIEQYPTEKVADSFILSEPLTEYETAENKRLLQEQRSKRLSEMPDSVKFNARLMQLKLRIKRMSNADFDQDRYITFEDIFSDYLSICGRSIEQFCNDIEVDYLLWNNVLKYKKPLEYQLLLRLSIHSGGEIQPQEWLSAYEWRKIFHKDRSGYTEKSEKKHVHWKLMPPVKI